MNPTRTRRHRRPLRSFVVYIFAHAVPEVVPFLLPAAPALLRGPRPPPHGAPDGPRGRPPARAAPSTRRISRPPPPPSSASSPARSGPPSPRAREHASLRSVGLGTNPLLWWGIAFEVLVTAAVVYLPVGQEVVGTAPLDAPTVALLLCCAPSSGASTSSTGGAAAGRRPLRTGERHDDDPDESGPPRTHRHRREPGAAHDRGTRTAGLHRRPRTHGRTVRLRPRGRRDRDRRGRAHRGSHGRRSDGRLRGRRDRPGPQTGWTVVAVGTLHRAPATAVERPESWPDDEPDDEERILLVLPVQRLSGRRLRRDA